jgi:probable rRNA maturation factor
MKQAKKNPFMARQAARLALTVENRSGDSGVPSAAQLRRWATAALQTDVRAAEVSLLIVDEQEGRELNRDYRGKDYATNVLTFAYNEGEEIADDAPTQADIILCTDVLEKEAAEQKKTVEEHTAHLIVHGVLHAQGYDHLEDEEAAEMEGLETEILAGLGFADPYA